MGQIFAVAKKKIYTIVMLLETVGTTHFVALKPGSPAIYGQPDKTGQGKGIVCFVRNSSGGNLPARAGGGCIVGGIYHLRQ